MYAKVQRERLSFGMPPACERRRNNYTNCQKLWVCRLMDLQFGLILATFIVSLIGTIVAFWRLEYAKRQYEISLKMLEESEKYWNARLKRDKKEQQRT